MSDKILCQKSSPWRSKQMFCICQKLWICKLATICTARRSQWNSYVSKLCHVTMKPDKPLNRNTKSETPAMNAPFDKKFHFDFKLSLVEETIMSDSIVWNHWTGNRRFGIEAVAKANGIDKTQLSNGHSKQRMKRVWNVKATWKLICGIEESAQLNENGIKDDTIWLHNFADNLSVARRPLSIGIFSALFAFTNWAIAVLRGGIESKEWDIEISDFRSYCL